MFHNPPANRAAEDQSSAPSPRLRLPSPLPAHVPQTPHTQPIRSMPRSNGTKRPRLRGMPAPRPRSTRRCNRGIPAGVINEDRLLYFRRKAAAQTAPKATMETRVALIVAERGDRTDGERSCDPGAEIDMPREIDHADPRVADGVDTGTALACAAQPGSTPGAAVRPDPTRPHMRESPSPDPFSVDASAPRARTRGRPRGTSAPAASCAPYSRGSRRHEQ
jgi:hypothetical protein